MRALAVAILATLVASGCHHRPPVPQRGVVEGDLGGWKFRRFQALLDIEVYVANNKGAAYSASYITTEADKRGRIADKDLVSVVVTKYEKPEGVVRATVKLVRRLAQEDGYQAEEQKIAGARALSFKGHGEAWVIWPSTGYIVKIGGRGLDEVPSAMVGFYAERYPSQLPGGALEGALPPGPDDTVKPPDKPAYDPNNPHPDLDKYDPKKSKLPDKPDKDK